MNTIKLFLSCLLVLLLADPCSAQSRIRFISKMNPVVTKKHTYSAKYKVKLMSNNGKWTRWTYYDAISNNALICGDTSYLLDSFSMINVKRPSGLSRVRPFIPFVAGASGTLLYGYTDGINEGIIIPVLFSAVSFPLSVYGVFHLFKQRPVYNLREWNVVVE